MEDMIPSRPSPALVTPQKAIRPKGKWAIALALLFLVMVAQHKGGWLAKIARHDLKVWLTTSTKIPSITGIRQRVVPRHERPTSAHFVLPIPGAKIIQGFGWTTTHGTTTFHAGIVVVGRPSTAVISGVGGQVQSLGRHQVSIAIKGHELVTYQDLASVSVRQGEHLGSQTVIGRLGKTGHLGIAITDQGLPINPLSSAFFGQRAFS